MENSARISGAFTKRDWLKLRVRLIQNIDKDEAWDSAAQIFRDRMTENFISPIELLLSNNDQGCNSVSISLIEISMIETLAGYAYGLFFNNNPDTQTEEELTKKAEYFKLPAEELLNHVQPYNYFNFSSPRVIVDFLMENPPFNTIITSEAIAVEFHENLYTGLIHNGMPVNGWKIRSNENPVYETFLEMKEKMDGVMYHVFYYNIFFNFLKQYIEDYTQSLLNRFNESGRRRFIRKLDEICLIKKVWFFAYGSQLYGKVLKRRIENIHEHRTCVLKHFRFRLDKKCEDGSVKANISHHPGAEVWGACYLLDYSDFKILAEKYERGYKYFDVAVHDIDGNLIIAKTFLSSFINNTVKPNSDYLNCIINGAYEKGLPLEYIWNIMDAYQ